MVYHFQELKTVKFIKERLVGNLLIMEKVDRLFASLEKEQGRLTTVVTRLEEENKTLRETMDSLARRLAR